ALSQTGDRAPELDDIQARFLNVRANTGADFDHRLMHLRLYLLAENHAALVHHLGDVRAQLARLGVDDLKLFFDSKSEVRHFNSRIANRGLQIDGLRSDLSNSAIRIPAIRN